MLPNASPAAAKYRAWRVSPCLGRLDEPHNFGCTEIFFNFYSAHLDHVAGRGVRNKKYEIVIPTDASAAVIRKPVYAKVKRVAGFHGLRAHSAIMSPTEDSGQRYWQTSSIC